MKSRAIPKWSNRSLLNVAQRKIGYYWDLYINLTISEIGYNGDHHPTESTLKDSTSSCLLRFVTIASKYAADTTIADVFTPDY